MKFIAPLLLLASTFAAKADPTFTTNVHQYAVKAVCASEGELAESEIFGFQSTTINLHNPFYEDTKLRWKLAAAQSGYQGEISEFMDTDLRPDGAMRIDCSQIRRWGEEHNALENGGFEGFVVIQSENELDVTSFHYAGDKESARSVEVETYQVRKITAPERVFQCHNGDAPMEAFSGWTSPQGLVRFSSAAGGQHISGVPWMTIGGTGPNLARYPNSFFFFTLDFCLCDDGAANVVVDSLRADNYAQTFLDGQILTPSVTNNFGGGPAGSGSLAALPSAGQHQLVVFARNFGSSSNTPTRFGVALSGTLSFENGYLGQCE